MSWWILKQVQRFLLTHPASCAVSVAPQNGDLAALPQEFLFEVVELLVAHERDLIEVERLRSSSVISSACATLRLKCHDLRYGAEQDLANLCEPKGQTTEDGNGGRCKMQGT